MHEVLKSLPTWKPASDDAVIRSDVQSKPLVACLAGLKTSSRISLLLRRCSQDVGGRGRARHGPLYDLCWAKALSGVTKAR